MSQLIDQINEFATNVRRLPDADQKKFYDGVRGALGPVKSSRIVNGETVEVRDVALEDLLTQPGVVPTDLRQDFRELCKALAAESKKRGAIWAGESVPRIVNKYLLPQQTPGEVLVSSTPGLLEALEKAGFVRNTPHPTT